MAMRRKRRGVEPGEFEDPLSNYDAPDYADDLERGLGEGQMSLIKFAPFEGISPDTSIRDAMATMNRLNIACLIVVDTQGKMAGILSERDILTKVANDFAGVADQPVSTIMTPEPVAVYETDSPAKAMNIMATLGFRHVPVLDVDDKVIGVVGPRRVNNYLQAQLEDESAA